MMRTDQQPIYVKVSIPSEVDRFKKSAAVTKEINNIAARLPTGQHTYFIEKLRNLKEEMLSPSHPTVRSQSIAVPSNIEMQSTAIVERIDVVNAPVLSQSITLPTNTHIHSTPNVQQSDVEIVNAPVYLQESVENANVSLSRNNLASQHTMSFKESSSIQILSSVENIIMPRKVVPAGRRKGSSKTTVIGTQRKTTKRKQSEIGVSEDVSPPKKKFDEMNQDEQALTIIGWLTKLESNQICNRKVAVKDIIKDPNVLNRLRNDTIFLGSLKKYVDVKSFEFLKDEVAKLYGKPWNCSHCNLNLTGKQIMCGICLDWFHIKCARLTKAMKTDFICASC